MASTQKKLPFELTGVLFVPEWKETGEKRLGGTGWRSTSINANPPDLLITNWLMRRVGRPSSPVLAMLSHQQDWDDEEQAGRVVLIQAHDGTSRTWTPLVVATITFRFVPPPPWNYCLTCGGVGLATYCNCERMTLPGAYDPPRDRRNRAH